MKKLTALFLSLLLIASIFPVAGAADGGSIAAAAVSAKPGETVQIPVTVTGNPGFSYLKLAFSYDDTALTFVKAENGTVSTDAFTPTAAALTWDSDNDATANGTLCTLTFTVKSNAKAGAYDVSLKLIQCFNYNEAPVAFSVTGGKLTVTPTADDFLPGDVDHDGSVTAADARLALRRAVELEDFAPGTYEYRAADIIQDGNVTAADARMILRVAVGLETQGVFFTPDGIYRYDTAAPSELNAKLLVSESVDGNELTVDLYLKDCVGLRSADFELTYDPEILEYAYFENGRDSEEIKKTLNNTFIYKINADVSGKIRCGSYFKETLCSSETFAANAWPGKTVNVNSAYFHAISFIFDIVSYPGSSPSGLAYYPYIALRCKETDGVPVSSFYSVGTCTHNTTEDNVTEPATCGKTGKKTCTCTVCGLNFNREIPATENHTFSGWTITTPATETAAGEKTRECSVCGKKETETIPPTGTATEAKITAAVVSAKPGETVDIPVTVSGNPGFSYLKLAFSYDDTALTFVKAENGAVSTDAFTPTAAALTWDSDNDAAANGTLCTLTFTVKSNAKEGAYDIVLKLIQCFNYDEAPVAFAVAGGKLTVTPAADDFLPGDVDHDGSVTAADARLALRRAVELEDFAPGSYEYRAADADRNGVITAADARLILRAAVGLEELK